MRNAIRRPLLALAFTVVFAGTLAPATVTLATTPVQNGCPASAALISVAYLESVGPYQLPGRLDDPANGGNDDGWVCAFPLPEAMSEAMGVEFTIYQFFENNLAAEGRP
jgi:hypothetical protein